MHPDRLDLAKILHPVEPEVFFRDYWEKKPLLTRRDDPDYYRGLPSLGDVDDVIAFSRPKFVEPGDFKPGGPQVRPFVQGWLADDEPFPRRSTRAWPRCSRRSCAARRSSSPPRNTAGPPRPRCAATWKRFFGCPVHANLYLTPKGAQGFHAHFDGHEVFVLQLEGTKHWRFYGPGRELPLPDEDGPVPPESLGPVTQEVFVQPGDMLYMPRGHVHEAFTSDQASMHLTVGVKVYRMADLVRLALDAVSRRDARFREAVPPGVLPAGRAPEALAERFRELLRALAEDGRVDEARGPPRRRASCGKLAPLPGDYFFAGDDADAVGPDTALERAPGVVFRLTGGDGWVGLEFPGGRIDGPAKIASALQFIARTPRFTPRELPDDLTADGKLLLVRRLVRARFLTPCRPGPGRQAAAMNRPCWRHGDPS